MNYPIFSRSDITGFWALFADTLANLLIISGVCRFVFNMPSEIVFGRILPGAAISIIIGIVVAAVLTGFGIIHDSQLHWFQFDSQIIWSYLILGGILMVASRFPLEREHDDEIV